MDEKFWDNKKVLITGHNGFKGCWLTKFIDELGAITFGYSLKSEERSVYNDLKFSMKHKNLIGDVRDKDYFKKIIKQINPDIVFHLAAQAIVKEAAENPVNTFETNLMGTVNLLEALKDCDAIKSIVVITSDKVYKNIEILDAYIEESTLGGDEPYSASKVCEEIAAKAYYETYFKNIGIGVATARASNTYGGCDHHFDRLIPYLIKKAYNGENAEIRNPSSIRPWQYILDLIRGYITLGQSLYKKPLKYSTSWNFGPNKDELHTVGNLAEIITKSNIISDDKKFKEAGLLLIDSNKSFNQLGWKPMYNLEEGLRYTCNIYNDFFDGKDIDFLMTNEIIRYRNEMEVKQNDKQKGL